MLKTAATAVVIGLVAVSRLRRYHPFPHFGLANQVTSVRALLVAAIAGVIGEPHTPRIAWIAIALSVVVTLLDAVDGWLARRSDMMSAFGARFDVEVDALLVQVLAILVWRYGKAGAWILAAGLLRYLFVAAGWMLPWMRRPLIPSRRGKAMCVVQIAGLVLALTPAVRTPVSTTIAACSLAALIYSFAVDTMRLWRQEA